MSTQTKLPQGKKDIDRLNKNPERMEIFYHILRDRLSLALDGELNDDNLSYVIYQYTGHKKKRLQNYYKAKLEHGLLVASRQEPEIVLRIAEIAHEMLGYYPTMDELITILFTWFIQEYQNPRKPKGTKPFKHASRPRGKNLEKFQKLFRPYYRNMMVTWDD
jgi:hypothetical protein